MVRGIVIGEHRRSVAGAQVSIAGYSDIAVTDKMGNFKAQRHLESLGVRVYTNTRVTAVDECGIVPDGKRIPAGTVLWGAGLLASPARQRRSISAGLS